MGPFQCASVSKRLGKFEKTAPGDEGLTYRHWKRLDPECTVLTEVINVCLRYKMVPTAWKRAVTVFIYKRGAKEDLNNWRPISLSQTLYKLYVGCVAGRLTEWMVSNKVLSPCQKGKARSNTSTLLTECSRRQGPTRRTSAWPGWTSRTRSARSRTPLWRLRLRGTGPARTSFWRFATFTRERRHQ